ncbi:hypothetical protein CEXT_310751 [Caerostris extrusa]|uniref:Neurotransmitter-gated ion-channel transmembrane domain-containing protein n=1 Tax=Caerostris extrusa TaxID=172846 RepID=A0AAV4S3C6_CAEEX|nr:hypothetical protein CEXT_310751 [Caerostris extrusa]
MVIVDFRQRGEADVGRRNGLPLRHAGQEDRAPAVLPGADEDLRDDQRIQRGQLHILVPEHHADSPSDGEHREHLRPLHPHRGRQLGDLLAQSGGSTREGGPQHHLPPHSLHPGSAKQVSTPSLNYITAVDIWLFTCIFMVFSTLVEFAISYNSQMNELKIIGSPSSNSTSAFIQYRNCSRG